MKRIQSCRPKPLIRFTPDWCDVRVGPMVWLWHPLSPVLYQGWCEHWAHWPVPSHQPGCQHQAGLKHKYSWPGETCDEGLTHHEARVTVMPSARIGSYGSDTIPRRHGY